MTLAEMRARRAAALAAATALVTAATVTTENRTQVQTLYDEVRQLGADITLLQEAETIAAEERSRVEAEERALRSGRPPLPAPGAGNADPGTEHRGLTDAQREQRNRQHQDAFRTYCRDGNASDLRAMGIGAGGNGGNFVPTMLMGEIESAVLSFGGLAPFLRQLNTSNGEPINWATTNDTSNDGQDTPQGTAQTEQDIATASVQLNVSDFGSGLVQVSRQLMMDSQFPIGQFVNENLSERLGRKLANKLTGKEADTNFDAFPNVVAAGPTSAAGTAIGLADIAALFGSVDPAYAQEFAMNRQTQIYLATLRNPLGAPIFPLDGTGMLTSIFGLPIRIDLGLPNIAVNARAVFCGNLKKYILRRVPGMEIQRLDERYAEYGQVAFLGWMRAGGRYIDAGTHPVKALVQAAQ